MRGSDHDHPAAVSRALRAAGFRTISPESAAHLPGVRVTRGAVQGTVVVEIATGMKSRDSRAFDQMRDHLTGAGYTVGGSSVWDGEVYMYSYLTVSKP